MTTEAYRERLLPAWWMWLLVAAFVTMLAVAYGAALGAATGWLVAVICGVVAVVLLWTGAPRIEVDDAGLHVGYAVLPGRCIAEVSAVDNAEIRRLQGPGSDARTFVALRAGAASGGVYVTLDDPEDPHPAWLVSSRYPDRLATAVAATMSR